MAAGIGSDFQGFAAGTVIFLFTDIEGSTRLWQEHPAAMKEALALHHALLRAAIADNGGSVFQIVGDGFCAAFPTAPAALAAAMDAQRALAIERWGATGPLWVRMALHAGPAESQAEVSTAGLYASGPTLSHAARLLAAAHGGQVLLSAAARGLVESALPDGAGLRDLGPARLRDLPHPEHVYQLTAPGLLEDFPPLRTADARRGNLPAPLTSFIGRRRELAELAQILEKARLLTLTGSGGTGKTRLALQLARDLEPRFPDGAWLLELAPVVDPALVVQVVATTLGLREQPGRPLLATLTDYLAAAQPLLVLDNCEHLLGVCATLVASLLQSCPSLVVLATSREPLAVPGEVTYRVASLSLPDPRALRPVAELVDYEAVRLFVERAQAAQPAFRLTDANAAAVARICQRVDGIPLAIELAATRVRTLSPDQIAARLDDYFNLLTGGSRSALPRQQTLRALIDWSHDLLSEPERALLRRLSVFSGGWTLAAAEAVGGDDVLDTLSRLVDRSLVIADMPDAGQDGILPPQDQTLSDVGQNGILPNQPDKTLSDGAQDGTLPHQPDETRYRLLEMIRQYAREKLLASGEPAAVRDAHLTFFAAVAAEADTALHGRDQVAWLVRLETELDNLRAAMAWAASSRPLAALQMAAHLREFWTRRGLAAEGRRWVGDALQRVEALPPAADEDLLERTQARAIGSTAMATLLVAQGETMAALQAAQQGVELARASGEASDLAHPLTMFAFIAGMAGRRAEAYAAARELLSLPRAAVPETWIGMTLGTLANLAVRVEGDYEKARSYMLKGAEIVRKSEDAWAAAMVTFSLGALAYLQNDYAQAQERYEDSLALWRGTHDRFFMLLPTSGLADVARQRGEYDRAIALYRTTIAGQQQAGNIGAIARCMECLAFIGATRCEAGPGPSRLSEHAARLLGAAHALRESSASPMTPEERAEYDAIVSPLAGTPGYAAAWRWGHGMARAQAVEYAMREDAGC